jgi:hypothetical protein
VLSNPSADSFAVGRRQKSHLPLQDSAGTTIKTLRK